MLQSAQRHDSDALSTSGHQELGYALVVMRHQSQPSRDNVGDLFTVFRTCLDVPIPFFYSPPLPRQRDAYGGLERCFLGDYEAH